MSGHDTQHGAGSPAGPASAFGEPGSRGQPLYEVTLWPNRSLSPEGFRNLMLFSATACAIPLMAFLGSRALWIMLPIVALPVWLLWWFLRRNYRDGWLTETLRLWPDLVTVDRREPSGRVLHWEANPYWVRATLHRDARLENYLTLKGGGREIELGAFLSPGERAGLYEDLSTALARARRG